MLGRRGRLGPPALLVVLAAACGGEPPAPSSDAAPAIATASSSPVAAAPAIDPNTLPGSIFFVSERDDDLEVYRWRASTPPERLTHDPRADFVAEVAPDGSGWTRVASEEGAVPEAYVEQILWVPRAGEPVAVSPPGLRARAPSWAPDRSFVVFESGAEQAFSDLWRWQPDGTTQRLTTTEHGAFEPAVAPDGRTIAYVSSVDGNPELYLMKADGTAPRRLTHWRRDDITPVWSPDGTRLAFLRREQGGERLFVLALSPAVVAGTEPPVERRLVPTGEPTGAVEKVKHAEHAWSPDGTRLAYTVHRPNQAPHVAVTEVESGRTQVASPPGLRATMPSWSPDGRYLAFTATAGDPDALDLYAVRLDDGALARLTEEPAADWLPRWIAH